MTSRSSSSGDRFDLLPLDFRARSRTSRRSSGESRFQYFRPSVLSQTIAASTLRHGTLRTAEMACRTHDGIPSRLPARGSPKRPVRERPLHVRRQPRRLAAVGCPVRASTCRSRPAGGAPRRLAHGLSASPSLAWGAAAHTARNDPLRTIPAARGCPPRSSDSAGAPRRSHPVERAARGSGVDLVDGPHIPPLFRSSDGGLRAWPAKLTARLRRLADAEASPGFGRPALIEICPSGPSVNGFDVEPAKTDSRIG